MATVCQIGAVSAAGMLLAAAVLYNRLELAARRRHFGVWRHDSLNFKLGVVSAAMAAIAYVQHVGAECGQRHLLAPASSISQAFYQAFVYAVAVVALTIAHHVDVLHEGHHCSESGPLARMISP